jgi:hypothetical protein
MTTYPAKQLNASICLTPADLMALGVDEFAYVRRYLVNGQTAFVLHSADGAAITVQKDSDAAYFSAEQQNLEILSVH